MKSCHKILGSLILSVALTSANAQSPVLHVSHDATAHIMSRTGNSSGSGTLISPDVVLTCLHVVSTSSRNQAGMVSLQIFPDLQVILSDGELIGADVISQPSEKEPEPLLYDFAFLKLRSKPKGKLPVLVFASELDLSSVDIGNEVVFSGYPLAAPGILTHKGMISGFPQDHSLFAIEAPVNKGNSGGALLNAAGRIIGIVSLREGGITQALADLRGKIRLTSQSGSVTIMGVNPLESTAMLIDTIDQYISVGIGYALSARYSSLYLTKHPQLLQ